MRNKKILRNITAASLAAALTFSSVFSGNLLTLATESPAAESNTEESTESAASAQAADSQKAAADTAEKDTGSNTETELKYENETDSEEDAFGWIEYITTEGGSISAAFEYQGETYDEGTFTFDMMDYGPWEAQYETTGTATVTASADDGYAFEAITITDGDGTVLAVFDTETASVVPSSEYRTIITASFVTEEETESDSEETEETSEKATEKIAEATELATEESAEKAAEAEAVTECETEAQDTAEAETMTEMEDVPGAEEAEAGDVWTEAEETEAVDEWDEAEEDEDGRILDGYPAEADTVSLGTYYVWYLDTYFDPASFQAYWDDTVFECLSDVSAFEFTIENSYTYTYKCVLPDEDGYYWYTDVTFAITGDRLSATVCSDVFDRIMPAEVTQALNEGYGGSVPSLAGETVDGREFTVLARDDLFDIYSLTMDYSTEYFKYYLADDGRYDCNTVGDYTVTYAVSHYMYPDYAWYVTNTVHVIDSYTGNGVAVIVDSYTMKAAASDGTAEYGIWYTSESGEFSMAVTDSYDISLLISATKDGEEVDPYDFSAVTDGDGAAEKTVTFAITDASEHSYVITLTNDGDYEGKALESGGGWYSVSSELIEAAAQAEDGSEEQEAALAAISEEVEALEESSSGGGGSATSDDGISAASDDGISVTSDDGISVASTSSSTATYTLGTLSATMVTGSMTGHNSDGSAETNYGTVKLVSDNGVSYAEAYASEINQLLEDNASLLGSTVTVDSSDIKNFNVYCISGHNYYGWPVSTRYAVSVTVKAVVTTTTDDNGGTATTYYIRLSVTKSIGSSYQTFSGSLTMTGTGGPETGYLRIRKRFGNAGLVGKSSLQGDLGTTFAVYVVTGYDSNGDPVFDEDDPYETIKMNEDTAETVGTAEDEDTGEEYITKLRYDVELPVGTYVLKETYRINGTSDNTGKVYGPYTVTAGNTYSVRTEWIYNYFFKFTGTVATKTDVNGTPLSGGVFLVEFYATQRPAYQDNGTYAAEGTWFFVSDSDGAVVYDKAHYLESWTDTEGILGEAGVTYYSDSLWVGSSSKDYALPVGSLKITEVQAPEGYEISENNVQTASIRSLADEDGLYTNVTASLYTSYAATTELPDGRVFENLSYGCLYLLKESSDSSYKMPLEGAVYKVYTDSGCSTAATDEYTGEAAVLTVGSDGKSNVVKLETNEAGVTYYIKETTPPEGYDLNSAVITVLITKDYTEDVPLKVTSTDTPSTGYIVMVESSSNTTVTSGNSSYSLKGAEYTVYTDSSCSTVATDASGDKAILTVADEAGNTNTLAMVIGTYYVKETKTPEGYKTDTTVYDVVLTTDYTASNPYKLEVEEAPYTPSLTLVKTSANSSVTSGNTGYSLVGAEYTVYTDSSCSTVAKDADGNDAVLTVEDEAGNSNTLTMPLGTYYVKETKTPEGYQTDTTIYTVILTADYTESNPYKLEISETPITCSAGILVYKKTDYSTSLSLEDAIFQLEFYAGATSADGEATRTWYLQSDEDGLVYFSYKYVASSISQDAFYVDSNNQPCMPIGFLKITEYQAPEGYVLSDKMITYTFTSDGVSAYSEDGTELVTQEDLSYENVPVLTDTPVFGGFSLDKQDAEFNDGSAQANASLEGFTFDVISLNDYDVSLKTDENTRYSYGDVVMTLTTDENGHAECDAIIQYGTYKVVETGQGEGYTSAGTNTAREIIISEDGEIIEYVVTNIPVKGGLSVQKFDYMLGEAIDHGDTDLSGAKFTIVNASSAAVKNMDGDTVGTSGLSGNDVTYSDVEAAIESGYVMQVIITDSDGYASTGVSDLPYGTYYVIETKAATGYQLNTTWVGIATVSEDGTVYGAITIQDSDSKETSTAEQIYLGGLSVQKIDYMLDQSSDHGDTDLSGAVFTIVNGSDAAAMNEDGDEIQASGLSGTDILYSDVTAAIESGCVMQTITTNAAGYAATGKQDLPYGTYYIIETTAATGYQLNTTWVGRVTVREDGKVYAAETIQDSSSEEDRVAQLIYLGGLSVQKFDYMLDESADHGDTDLSGAEFTIVNASDAVAVNVDGDEILTSGLTGTDVTYADVEAVIESGCVMQTITTGSDGFASTGKNDLPYGTYYVIETKAATGYQLNTAWVGTATVREDGVVYAAETIQDSDSRDDSTAQQIFRGGITLVKNDIELQAADTQGYTSLEGAEFAIINASDAAAMNKDGLVIPSAKSILSDSPTYAELRALADDGSYTMQVITTDAEGYAETGVNDLPYGTYYVIEIKSSYGYWIDESFVGNVVIRDDGVAVALGETSGGSSFTDINDMGTVSVDQTPRRSDLNFLKVNIDGEYKAYIPFLISAIYVDDEGNEVVLESHVIVSDANGLVDTSRTHSTNTNGFDQYVADGVVTEEGEALLEEASAWGIWFGSTDAVNDDYGALYPAYYRITEIQCEDNVSLSENLLESDLIYIYNDTGDLTALLSDSETNNAQENTYHPLVDTEIVLTSAALDVESGTQTVPVRESVEVSDTVTFTHVSSDHTYRMETQFVDITDGSTVLSIIGTNDEGTSVSDDGLWVTKEFQPEKQSGTNNTYGDIILTALLNTEGLSGHTIVAVDYLYQYVNGYWILVAKHEDLTDTDQMLYVADIHTTATDSLTGTRVGAKSTEDAILDAVAYSNLAKGEIYVIVMQVLDADTGEAIEDGKTVQSSRIYSRGDTPVSGTIEMPEFTLDSSSFNDRTLVAVESLYRADADGNPVGEAILVHDSPVDEDQTIRYPEVHTSASDGMTQDDVGTSSETATVYDEVTIENVIFDDNDMDGQYTYTLKGTLVYQQDFTDSDGVSHKAGEAVETLDGSFDSVTFTSDAAGNATFTYADGSMANGKVTITSYGQNVAKTAGGDAADNSYVTDSTAAAATITVELIYLVDSSKLEGGTVVVFEDLYHEDVKVASHADLTDEGQSIHYPEVKTSAVDDSTADDVGKVQDHATITDTVTFTNLVPGKTYTVSGRLVNQSDGSDLTVNGRSVTQSATITVGEGTITAANGEATTVTEYDEEYNSVDGTVQLIFSFDASTLEEETVVVFEDLIYNGVTVAVHSDLTDEGQTVHFPKIRTTAADGYTLDSVGTVAGDTTFLSTAVIVDTVTYSNLVPGREYTVSGILVNKDSEWELVDADNHAVMAERTFIAGETGDGITVNLDEKANSVSGTIDIIFTFDGSLLEGVTVVAFESLEHNGVSVTTHSDINDEDETIHFPKVRTSAMDETVGDEAGNTGETVIIDTVSIWNLVPGMTYTVSGVLMDKETGEELLVDGGTITQSVTITVNEDGTVTAADGENVVVVEYDEEMNSVDCTVDLTYVLDASALAGVTTVVFEDLIHHDVIVASHADLTDPGQSVHFPEIHTTAADLDTSDHVGTVEEDAVINDVVYFSNLVVGKEYTLTGTLMNRGTGLPLLDENGAEIIASVTFTAGTDSNGDYVVTENHEDNNSVDGTCLLSFTLDSSLLAGKTVVVFESLYHNGIEVTIHADINDDDQSVYYPDIHTTAVDYNTGDHVGTIWGAFINFARRLFGSGAEDDVNQVITDTVALENLVPGMTYVVSGKLYNVTESLATGEETPLVIDGEEITRAATITVSEDGKSIIAADGSATSVTAYNEELHSVDGTVDLVYTLNSSKITGIQIVVFEKLYQNATYTPETSPEEVDDVDLVNEHTDIEDEDQSVSEISIHTTAVDTTTGDHVGSVPDGTAVTAIHDEVNLAGLVPGMEYTIDGVLVSLGDSDLSSGEISYLKVDGTLTTECSEAFTEMLTFMAEETSGTYYLNFAIASDKVQGKSLTVFENIYHNDILISSHPAGDGDEWDEDSLAEQTVSYPAGKTNAIDASTMEHISLAEGNRVIIDRVYFENLLVGQEYTITGQLVYKEAFTDADGVSHAAGEAVTAAVAVHFTAAAGLAYAYHEDGSEAAVDSVSATTLADGQTTISGYASISFTVDASKLTGATLVAFESFSHNGTDIYTHNDLENLPQTIRIPAIGTTANVPGPDGAAVCDADGNYIDIIITDTVAYENLWTAEELTAMAGQAKHIIYQDGTVREQKNAIYTLSEDAVYILKGVLMDKETGEALSDSDGDIYTVYSEPFTPESSGGSYDMTFTINAGDFLDEDGNTTLAGKSLVVFEELFLASAKEDATEENRVAEHQDIDDEAQTVSILPQSTPETSETSVTAEEVKTGDLLEMRMIWAVLVMAAALAVMIIAKKNMPAFNRKNKGTLSE
ncbi:MAG: VaFE repeat-containing surface-anchored protein [Lachnospiraceae bacterium]|nr:VaFE repeat-containing surface-anchored protein [Lachnospiraceae bacterium]